MTDADQLPPNYDQWRKKADGLKRQIERSGQVAVEATIDPETFPAWCAARGLDVDAKARMQFANEEAYRRLGQTH